MNGDGRSAAWMAAWNRLDAATKYRLDYRKTQIEESGMPPQEAFDTPLPPEYHAYVKEADVFARMAQADTLVGLVSGDNLEIIARREEEREAMEGTFFDGIMNQERARKDQEKKPDED